MDCSAFLAVYNRDNKLKVARDEAKAKEEEDKAKERYEQAEREHRLNLLLRRAGGGPAPAPKAADEGAAAADASKPAEQQLPQHINFWREEEARVAHPENEVGPVPAHVILKP